jgi:hypothetical protein
MKTSELTGAALDWAVAKCEGKNGILHDDGITRCIVIAAPSGVYKGVWRPSINWAQGGPIIDGENISLHPVDDIEGWSARKVWGDKGDYTGPTPLIAAMRCYVASKLGDDVDVPKELA